MAMPPSAIGSTIAPTRQAGASGGNVLPELLASLLAAQAGKQSICAELATLAADLQQADSTIRKARAP